MNGGNYTQVGLFFGIIYLLTNEMTSKFIVGFVTGIFVSTKYDFKPYVSLIEDKIITLQRELEIKRDETKETREIKETDKPQVTNWNFSWPWSVTDQDSKKN